MNDVLDRLPPIHRLDLGHMRLPDWHPRSGDKVARLFAYAIEHPVGLVLFDCGCGHDSPEINDAYRPTLIPVHHALANSGLDVKDVAAIVLSHLHFDHCGQLSSLRGRPTYVQKAEVEAARAPDYTIDEWAAIPDADRRALDGDTVIAKGMSVIWSPGHTPGHQSLVVRGGGRTTIIGGQCCYSASSFAAPQIEADNLFDPSWEPVAKESLRRLRALNPDRILLAHDANDWLAS